MPPRYTIFKIEPATGKKIALHEGVPEQISDWLCKICELELRSTDLEQGYRVVKELQGSPAHHEGFTAQAS
jgi:hypothetical protein